MNNKAYAVPLHELLAGVPRGARLEITDPDGMGTRFIPVGRYCHEAAEILRAKLNKPKKEWVGLTDEELLDLADMAYANDLELLQTLQVKLKEKNS